MNDASTYKRRLMRRVTGALPHLQNIREASHQNLRRLRRSPHVIDLFYQVGDPYSDLALQAMITLAKHYNVQCQLYLVSPPDLSFAPEPDLLAAYARQDCARIAPHYKLTFPTQTTTPNTDQIALATRVMAAQCQTPQNLHNALKISQALWHTDVTALQTLADHLPQTKQPQAEALTTQGNQLLHKRRHYQGGMFWYAGGWYWGVDRLYHLEQRLTRQGLTKNPSQKLLFPRPAINAGPHRDQGKLTLEIYPSLRSPYTAMILARSLEMARSNHINVELYPVLPMVMRDKPVPKSKGIYIYLDAHREAKHLGIPYGDMFDPLGTPIARAYSLWPFAQSQHKGGAFLCAFLHAAFVEGRDTSHEAGLRHVLAEAGLDWDQAKPHLNQPGWEEIIEANRQRLYNQVGVWGVPSFRLRDPSAPDFCVWGQDRLWLLATELRRRLAPP